MKFIDLVKNSINTICAKYLNEKEEIEYLPIFYINFATSITSRRRSGVYRKIGR